ncbi:hypothetical protein ACH5RR_006500 [Cinchona calisaya]|uniref:Uncharacterized protein n=1 Tax=Cinchona calisaya TaxID=153742 RepID=A0ABD3AP59_9GENT
MVTAENLVGTFFRLWKITNTSERNYLIFDLQGSYLRHIPNSSILHVTGDSDVIPKWPWFVFLGGAMCCLIFSSLAHTFACHSKRFYLFFWRLDYAVIGSLSIFTLLAPALSSGRFRSFRAILFLTMGFSGVIRAAHAVVLYWDNNPQIQIALGYEVVMGLLYAAGVGFYTSRIPERWRPGSFDIIGHSHQIFHVFVVAAALAHCAATLIIMDWRRGLPTSDGMSAMLS